MMNVHLANKRGLKKEELLDHMGSKEMAANLFRIEMTKARLEKDGLVGQSGAERIHRHVGSRVREIVKENTGHYPEDLPVERRLPDVAKELKIGQRKMKAIDGKKPTKKTIKRPEKEN